VVGRGREGVDLYRPRREEHAPQARGAGAADVVALADSTGSGASGGSVQQEARLLGDRVVGEVVRAWARGLAAR
jgi:hypothetical protein